MLDDFSAVGGRLFAVVVGWGGLVSGAGFNLSVVGGIAVITADGWNLSSGVTGLLDPSITEAIFLFLSSAAIL